MLVCDDPVDSVLLALLDRVGDLETALQGQREALSSNSFRFDIVSRQDRYDENMRSPCPSVLAKTASRVVPLLAARSGFIRDVQTIDLYTKESVPVFWACRELRAALAAVCRDQYVSRGRTDCDDAGGSFYEPFDCRSMGEAGFVCNVIEVPLTDFRKANSAASVRGGTPPAVAAAAADGQAIARRGTEAGEGIVEARCAMLAMLDARLQAVTQTVTEQVRLFRRRGAE
jgi:hypothetical protein